MESQGHENENMGKESWKMRIWEWNHGNIGMRTWESNHENMGKEVQKCGNQTIQKKLCLGIFSIFHL